MSRAFRRAAVRSAARVLSLLALAAAAVACTPDQASGPARLVPSDADRGVSTATAYSWSSWSTPYGSYGSLADMNDSGWVVGYDGCWQFRQRGKIAGGYTPLDSVINYFGRCVGVGYWEVARINNRGTALYVTPFDAEAGSNGALIGVNNKVTPLTGGTPVALNDSGVAVGASSWRLEARPIIWRGGRAIDVTPPGFTGGVVTGIDSSGTIYGGTATYFRPTPTVFRGTVMVCAWMHRRGVDTYQNCVVDNGASLCCHAVPYVSGVIDVNSRGDAVGRLRVQERNGTVLSYRVGGSFEWPASDATLTADPNPDRWWVAISDKGRLVGTQPGLAGARVMVTRSPAGVVNWILDHPDGTPRSVNSCGVIVGSIRTSLPRWRFTQMSIWSPSVCD